jgi:cysteine-rich repeat protein
MDARTTSRSRFARALGALTASFIAVTTLVSTAGAVDYAGTVDFQGDVSFSAPIAGIAETDLVISVKPATEATGQGTKCSISGSTSDSPDVIGNYPDAGSVDADYLVERGGPNLPEGECITTIVATGTDGVSVSARGTQTVFLDVNDVDLGGTVVVPTIVVRQSKALAGLDKDCRKWLKKQMKLRDKCNSLLMKKSAAVADKCKDAGPEPVIPELCDPGNFVEAVLASAHAANDFQTNPPGAPDVDEIMYKDQVTCQKRIGKAAVNYTAKYTKLVDKKCVQALNDNTACREEQVAKSRKKLEQIDKCVTDQIVDGGSGTTIPVVGAPCTNCISGAVLDRKCLKSCFEAHMAELGDGMVGDLPECGNGILQGGEFCDDGNLVNGDCCSDTCGIEAGVPEGPNGNPTCTDLVDNDCDGDIDAADVGCQP